MLYPVSYRKKDLFDPFTFRSLRTIQEDLSGHDFFEAPLPLGFGERKWYPTVDIYEESGQYTVKADLPGIKQEDIKVSLENDILTIKGERTVEHSEKEENYHIVERSSGKFQRCFQLPGKVDADKIKARFHDGVLDITLPKVEEEKEKKIQIEVN